MLNKKDIILYRESAPQRGHYTFWLEISIPSASHRFSIIISTKISRMIFFIQSIFSSILFSREYGACFKIKNMLSKNRSRIGVHILFFKLGFEFILFFKIGPGSTFFKKLGLIFFLFSKAGLTFPRISDPNPGFFSQNSDTDPFFLPNLNPNWHFLKCQFDVTKCLRQIEIPD